MILFSQLDFSTVLVKLSSSMHFFKVERLSIEIFTRPDFSMDHGTNSKNFPLLVSSTNTLSPF